MTSRAAPPTFFEDYSDNRSAFLDHARRANAALTSQSIAAVGPHNEPLWIDSAYIGAPSPEMLVVVTSGVHGVEGPAGGALQRMWLDATMYALPEHTGMLHVHAVNPYGFAHGRRVNENNVDLNRNAIDRFPGPENPGYRDIQRWLNPRSPCGTLDDFWWGALTHVLRKGRPALRQAIAGGQYEFPRGLFFGGNDRQASLQIFSTELAHARFARTREVLHLDLHTGLGEFGNYKVLVDVAPSDAKFIRLGMFFGIQSVASDHRGNATYYAAHGLLPEITARSFPHADVTAAVIEFGTYSATHVLRTLRAENRARHHGCRTPAQLSDIKRRMRDTFLPADPAWRERLHEHGNRLAAHIIRYATDRAAALRRAAAPA